MFDEDIRKKLDEYFEKRRDTIRDKYDRVLPSGEYIFNRFDKAK